ncbi:MAG: GNAT family N-acetyltransferase [candidate division WOR-3 bacterium]|nr:MAG: GNAT family N-acetyltransferase [candidate division WOR-3 bacterium]
MLRNLPIIVEELVISELTLDDLDYLYGFSNLKEIKEFLPDRYETKEELKRTLEWLIGNYSKSSNEIIRISLGIRLKAGNIMIGWITYGPLPYDEKLNEIAYAIHPAYWNKGYATMAGKAFLKWLSENTTNDEIFAEVNPQNHSSIRVLEKLGMVKIKEDIRKKAGITEKVLIYKLQKYVSL